MNEWHFNDYMKNKLDGERQQTQLKDTESDSIEHTVGDFKG